MGYTKDKKEFIGVRVNKEERQLIQDGAKRDNKTISKFVVDAIKKSEGKE